MPIFTSFDNSPDLQWYSNTLTNTLVTLKSGRGKLLGYDLYNNNSAQTYIQIFDIQGPITLGTTTPTRVIVLPANGGRNVEFLSGLPITNALVVVATTTRTGSTNPTNVVDVNFFFI